MAMGSHEGGVRPVTRFSGKKCWIAPSQQKDIEAGLDPGYIYQRIPVLCGTRL